jgi:hypothetical protein
MTNEKTVTLKQVVAATGKTEMTVFNWRRGSAQVNPLPTVTVPRGLRHKVLVPRGKFLKWAAEHGVAVDLKRLDA